MSASLPQDGHGLRPSVQHVVDVGLSIIYKPKDAEPCVDIVFVHGLQGHPRNTWYKDTVTPTLASVNQKEALEQNWKQNLNSRRSKYNIGKVTENRSQRGVFWPAELLPQDCPKARIMTFGYDSRVTKFFGGAVSQNNVFANAKNLLYALNRLRYDCNGRFLIFIAHSLGGIVVKEKFNLTLRQVLRRAKYEKDSDIRDISISTKGVFFLGTPHRGSHHASLAEVARRIVASVGFDTSDRNLRALHFDSAELEFSHEEFIQLWKDNNFTVRTFQEGRGLTGFQGLNGKVVQDFSSSLDDVRQKSQHINANHREMCRFNSRNDPGYEQVVGELRLLVEQLHQESMTLTVSLNQNEEKGPQSLTSEEKACLHSLCFKEIDSRHQNIYPGLERTCQWFFARPEYLTWIDVQAPADVPGLLWLKGKPGAGKSTLMKTMLHHESLSFHERMVSKLAFFFNGLGTRLEKSLLGLFRSLVHQFLRQNRHLLQGFLALYQRKVDMHGDDWEWYRWELEEYFSNTIKNARTGPIFIIIDALDECEEASARELVTLFEDLIASPSSKISNIRICLSSRYYPNIATESCTDIHMDEYNEPDIQLYIEKRLRLDSKVSGFAHLIAEIVRKASGIFLWVVLVVKKLVRARDEGESLSRMQQIIRDVPEQLNDLIKQLINSINSEHRQEALRLMQWVLFASRPLNTAEIRYALAFGGNSTYSSQEEAGRSDKLVRTEAQLEKFIRSRTRGLVEIKQTNQFHDEEDRGCAIRTVNFIHESVTDVLLQHGGLQMMDNYLENSAILQSHHHLARTCMNYLSISEIRGFPGARTEPQALGSIQAAATLKILHEAYPFLEYAVQEIFHHAKGAESTREPYAALSKFLMTDFQQLFQAWRYLSDLDQRSRYREAHGPHTTFAHVAAEYDMVNWISLLLQQGIDINVTGGRFHSLIQTASAMGHETLVDRLLELGADINLRGGRHENVLTAAAFDGNLKIIKAILEGKPNVNALGGEYGCALQAAAASRAGTEENIQLLLDAKANVNTQGGRHGNALQAAAFKGNERVVGLLLDAGANINAIGGEHGTALQAAAFQGHEAIVEVLLASGADSQAEAGSYGTALWAAAYSGHVNIARLLLETNPARSNASILPQESANVTPYSLDFRLQRLMDAANATKRFHEAVGRGDINTMQTLIDNGVDANARGGDLSSAWHLAAWDGRSDVLQLLLAQPDLIPDMQDPQGRTPLWYAASEGHQVCVRQLADTGSVDYNVKSSQGRNLLWFPFWNGHLEVARFLLARGVSPYEKDCEGISPLMAAEERGQRTILNLISEGNFL